MAQIEREGWKKPHREIIELPAHTEKGIIENNLDHILLLLSFFISHHDATKPDTPDGAWNKEL